MVRHDSRLGPYSPRTPHPARRWLKLAAVAVVLIAAAYALWRWANDMAGVRRDAPKVTAIIPLPPPPPPPPEPEKPPEPEQPKDCLLYTSRCV